MLSWAFKNRNMRPIGLDIGHNSVKMIQFLSNGNQLSVLAIRIRTRLTMCLPVVSGRVMRLRMS